MTNTVDFVSSLIDRAKKAGADAADAAFIESTAISASLRLGKPENIERSESKAFGLRVMVGKKQAMVSSTSTDDSTLALLIERAVSMAKNAPEDPYSMLAPENLLAKNIPDLDLYDSQEPSAEALLNASREAEEAALAVQGITNSEGADASYSSSAVAIATSNGFAQGYCTSSSAIGISVLAGEGVGMERDDDYSIARFRADLTSPALVGRMAAERAIKRLNPRKVQTTQAPVVFDARVAKTLLGSFVSAINGAAIARGTSFLKNKMGEQIFNPNVTIIDDPYRLRGLSSRPFDGEGVAGRKLSLIDKGILTTWLLDLRSAKQLGLETTGSAIRGLSSPPAPSSTNLYMENGTLTVPELIADIKSGFYVTDLFGMGINLITGDYSQGASGFWIENGEIAYAVSEITIAGHLSDMFLHLTPANDLVFHYGTNAPTIRVEKMTIAGV